MKKARCLRIIRVWLVVLGGLCPYLMIHASDLDTIGVTVLETVTTNLNGTGVRVGQPEAFDSGTTNWEVNPGAGVVEQPTSLFTYTSGLGTANTYPNSINTESGHADSVAGNFYGIPGGVATNVAHVDNYDANYFIQVAQNQITLNYSASIHSDSANDSVVNQSFIFGAVPLAIQQVVDSAYDNYAAQHNTLFVSGAGNNGQVSPPATCYNGIGVGVSDGGSSFGPTPDNGRAKPDIIAPGGAASFPHPMSRARRRF